MGNYICYTQQNGNVAIVLGEVWSAVPPDAINPHVVKKEDLPKTRDFRNAWKNNGESITIDMEKAAAIHMDRIRAARNEKLKELDVEYIKALEKDLGIAQTIAEEKQVLRDIPQTFDLSVAKTPDELIKLWPEELKIAEGIT